MWTDDKIILLRDISAPPAMAGAKGDVKVVDRDIPLYYAKLAVKGGLARLVEDEAEIEAALIELGLKEPKQPKKIKKRKEKTKDAKDGQTDTLGDRKEPGGN